MIWTPFVKSIHVQNLIPGPEILCLCVAMPDRPRGAELLEICNENSTDCTWNAEKGVRVNFKCQLFLLNPPTRYCLQQRSKDNKICIFFGEFCNGIYFGSLGKKYISSEKSIIIVCRYQQLALFSWDEEFSAKEFCLLSVTQPEYAAFVSLIFFKYST